MAIRLSHAVEHVKAFFVGRDVFVSYCYKDSAYAEALAVALGQRKLSIFVGAWGASPGNDLSSRVVAAMTRSRLLVVIATPWSLGSGPVEQEIAAFTKRARPVVPVDVGLAMTDPKTAWPAIAGTDVIREPLDAAGAVPTGPSTAVVDRIVNAAAFMRQETRLIRFLTLIVLAVTVLSIVSYFVVRQSRAAADDASVRRDHATTLAAAASATARRARGETVAARLATGVAEVQAKAAEARRQEAISMAERESSIGTSVRTANQANALLEAQPSRIASAALLAVESVRHLNKRGVRSLAADTIIRTTTDLLPWVTHVSRYAMDRMATVSPDGRWIAEQTRDGKIDIVDIADGKRRSFDLPDGFRPSALAFSANGTALVARCRDSNGDHVQVVVWSVADGGRVSAFTIDPAISHIGVSNDGQYIASAGSGGVRVAKTDGTQLAYALLPAGYAAGDVNFSNDGDLVAVSGSPPLV
jgi:hypothetical protein